MKHLWDIQYAYSRGKETKELDQSPDNFASQRVGKGSKAKVNKYKKESTYYIGCYEWTKGR